MCPLRIILIFLSATLAGFFVLRNLKSQPESQFPSGDETHENLDESEKTKLPNSTTSPFSKVCSAMESGFWTCVDMASGRYLWRHLVSSNSKRSE
ncbi:hypothetical protein L484_010690 [Morus notabilis]|uniref:Methyltransferase-related protein n=1 Tax=Morus notabilis TaxID=981085 RepID=W9SAE2_9ROSA|nr:uncharacterized protein LOC21393979 [Morus notabilis]EXC19559.1 hypothetical protein L484_010690 [Morus notabilis]